MKKAIIILIYLIALILGISCQNQSKRVEQIIKKAEKVLEHKPDSTLALLHEIASAEKLSKRIYYQYYLLEIQAKYKSYKDIKSDTLIFTVRDYYREKKDIENAALATYYSGKVLQEQKNYEKAIEEFLKADYYFKQTKNLNLKGLCQSAIGKIYYDQLLKEKALIHFKLAKNYFHQAKDYKNEIIAYNLIGNCLLMQEKIDSAFISYHDAIKLADKYSYKKEQAGLRVSLGVGYREIQNWEQSESFFREAWVLINDSIQKAKLSINLAQLFELQGKNDSSVYYLQKALTFLSQQSDNYIAAKIYKTWSDVEIKANNFQEALKMYERYSDYLTLIFEENKNRAVLEIEKKYNYQLVENRNKQLLIERQRILLFLLLLLIVFLVFVFLVFRYSVKNRRKLEDTEQKVRQLKKLASSFDDKEESYRNVLIQHMDIIKKAALLEGYLNEDERKKGQSLLRKFNEVVYGQKKLDWELLYQTLNKLSAGYFGRFKEQFPLLEESEFRICCLLHVDFNNTEIAIILNYSINTIQAKKSLIRKKLGINSYGNIQDFMKEAIQS